MNVSDTKGLVQEWQKWGLVELSPKELEDCFYKTTQAIRVGVEREGEATERDGGVLAHDSLIEPMYQEKLEMVSDGVRVATGNFGGTHWQTGWVEKVRGDVVLCVSETKTFSRNERKFSSPEEFGGKMVELLMKGLGGDRLPSVVAISLGFRHEAKSNDGEGLGAVIQVENPAKFWQIRGISGLNLGELLVNEAKYRNWKIEKVVITNDAVAVALDVPGSRLGFVGGSGTNGALMGRKHHNHLINLELGRLGVFPQTELVKLAQKEGQLGEQVCIAEYFTGGGYLVRLWQLAVEMWVPGMAENERLRTIEDAEVLSFEVNGEHWRTDELLGQEIGADEHLLLKMISERLLYRAGQTMGVMQAALASLSGDDWPVEIPTEGSVFWRGAGVKETASDTVIKLIGQKVKCVEAMGVRGVARYALSIL